MAVSTATAEVTTGPSSPSRAPSSLGHEMIYTDVTGLRRIARSWRLFRQIRGRLSKGTILTIRVGGSVPDAEPQRTLFDMIASGGASAKPTSLEAFSDGVRLASHDPRISGILLVIDPLSCGWARVLEMRRHLQYFSSAGKDVTVFMEQGGPKEFFLAMGFELYVPPLGNLTLQGFSVSAAFVRGILDKVGVAPQVERIGAYKSAGDQLNRTEMSPEQREMLNSILGEIDSTWVTSVSEACGISEESVRAVVEKAPKEMEEFVTAGFVTGLKYLSQVREDIILKQNKNPSLDSEKKEDILKRGFRSVSLRNYRRRTKEKTLGLGGPSDKRIALIRANGAITGGKSGNSPAMGDTLGSDSLVPLIRKAAEDKRIAAVVIRCDSPGGSALASDIVYEEVCRLKAKKPVIASMGDVSASGGYYISMGANEIVAENLTLTGSVGVVLAKLSLGTLYEKVGYSKETLSIGRYAQLFADERTFTEDEAKYWKEYAEVSYKSFVTKAADARGKSYEDMHKVAQGRVWTGKQALERGMIDHIGGLRKAIEVAKEKAEIKGDYVSVTTIAEPQGLSKLLSMDGTDDISAQAPSAAGRKFGVEAPLAITEVSPLLSGPSPLVSFLAAAVAAAPEVSAFANGTGPSSLLAKIISGVVQSLMGNSLEER